MAREEILKQRRISFNQNMIETVFEPGEMVRYYNHTVHRVGETGEIASKWKLKNRKYEVVSREGTIYALRDQDTGATKRAHVSQLARMRLLSGNKPKATAGAVESGPSEEVLWDKLRAGKFVLFYIKGDPRSYVRCAEVTQVDAENRGFTVWYNIHRVPSKKGQAHDFERPLNIIRFTPEFRNKRGDSGWVPMTEQERKGVHSVYGAVGGPRG